MSFDYQAFDCLRGVSRLVTSPRCLTSFLPLFVGCLLVRYARTYALILPYRRTLPVLAIPFILLSLYYASHLESNAITKRPQFIAFTPAEFAEKIDVELKAIQRQFWAASRKPTRRGNYRRMLRTASTILGANRDLPGISNKTWAFAIVRASTPSAFILPNCRTYLFDGIFTLCNNDDTLSFVLAHEMAHCLLEHTLEKESLAFGLDKLTNLVWLSTLSLVRGDVRAVLVPWFVTRVLHFAVFLPHSRFMELESDAVGLQMIAKACFDFRYSIAYFDKAAAFGRKMAIKKTRKMFSTHPTKKERVRRLYTQMHSAMELRKSRHCPRLVPLRPRVRYRMRSFVADTW
ncbi:unnamed protein product [Ixodes hexagonus]